MKLYLPIVAAALAAIVLTAPASAQTTVKGKVKQTTVVGKNTTVAAGSGAKATTKVGTVEKGTVHGDVRQTTVVGGTTTTAIGKNAKGCVKIGTVGSKKGC